MPPEPGGGPESAPGSASRGTGRPGSAGGRRPGLREQVSITIEAVRRLIDAHVALAKAELAGISENVQAVAAEAGLAIAAALFAVLLLAIGTTLFLGEWWFGSMGWGVAHGTATSIAVIVVAAGFIVKPEGMHLARDLVLAILFGIVVAIVWAMGLTNQAWQAVTDALNLGLDEAYRLIAVAVSISVIVFAILGGVVGAWRGGGRSVTSGIVMGVFVGLLFGLLTAWEPGRRVGVALGILFGLILLAVLTGLDIARGGIDEERLKARFYPGQTIATTKETLEWLQAQSPMEPRR